MTGFFMQTAKAHTPDKRTNDKHQHISLNKIKQNNSVDYSICCLFGFLSISCIPNIIQNQFTYWSLFLLKAHENYSVHIKNFLKKSNSTHIQIHIYTHLSLIVSVDSKPVNTFSYTGFQRDCQSVLKAIIFSRNISN